MRVISVMFCLYVLQTIQLRADIFVTVDPDEVRQVFEGLGCGVIYYEAHITSFARRKKYELQEQLYDDMFSRVRTRYLQLMIRETHEASNDNDDPFLPEFKDEDFAYCEHTIAIAKAALKRQPEMQLHATLYTPPPWMKTNNDASGGGVSCATLIEGLELELAEYIWAFLAHMQKNGVPVRYLSIANEPDWRHTQPGYFLEPEQHAALLKAIAEYLDAMADEHPEVSRPRLVAPNTLSVRHAVHRYVPRMLESAPGYLDVVASHDYDWWGDRWDLLCELSRPRSVWMSEWCARDKDNSPGKINSAMEYGKSMYEAFRGGVNVYMMYDWVYPPHPGGVAMIYVNWGQDYVLSKPYYFFRQWAEPLEPGMRFVETEIGDGGSGDVKVTSFVNTNGTMLVVHAVNTGGSDETVSFGLAGGFAGTVTADTMRTSGDENMVVLPSYTGSGMFTNTLPGKSITTYVINSR